jgi:hypothetical protein
VKHIGLNTKSTLSSKLNAEASIENRATPLRHKTSDTSWGQCAMRNEGRRGFVHTVQHDEYENSYTFDPSAGFSANVYEISYTLDPSAGFSVNIYEISYTFAPSANEYEKSQRTGAFTRKSNNLRDTLTALQTNSA